MKHGQISTEFIILFALVLLIFIPLFFLITNETFRTQDTLTISRADTLAQLILDQSVETYYLGRESREIISIQIPDGVTHIGVITATPTGAGATQHYLAINQTVNRQPVITSLRSDIPISITATFPNVCAEANDICSADYDCELCTIPFQGRNRARLQLYTTSTGDPTTPLAVQISLVST